MIDTHSHIYLEQFDEDRDIIISSAREAGVRKILLPNVDSTTIERMHNTEKDNPEMCFSMMGVHPTSVNDNFQKELQVVEEWLHKRPYVGVGEIGIDLYWDKTYVEEQKEAFEIQINWAKQLGLPIVIHCRDAFAEVFEVVDKNMDDQLKGVFHSFTGTEEDARHIMEYNSFVLGINGVVTFKNTNLRQVLKQVPMQKVVMETDAPYLAPVPFRGKRNQPAYINKVAGTLSEVYDVSLECVIAQTSENASAIFKL